MTKCKLAGCNEQASYDSINCFCKKHEELYQREKNMEKIVELEDG